MATTRITNGILLQHMQGMKAELKQDIQNVSTRIDQLEQKVDKGFKDARQHREALQEDLNATILMVGKHQRKLARL